MERDMDQVKKMTQHHQESGARRANSFKGRCLIPVKRKPQRGITTTLDEEPIKPDVVELNLKASLMGVKIYGDKDHFFSRQSSMSSNRLSSKFIPCCSGRPSVDQSKEISIVASSKPPSYKRDSLSKLMASSPERSVSGVLYPSPQVGHNTHGSILNAVHFTFGDVTEKIYKQLLDQSEFERKDPIQTSPCKPERYSDAASTLFCESDKYPRVSYSSLTFSERLFGYEFSKDSPQQAKAALSADQGCDDSATDDNDIILEDDIIFEVPNGIALRSCGHDYAELVMVGPRPRAPKCERWSSNKQSFNLELEQRPINATRGQPARAKLDVSHRDMSKREPVDHPSFRSDHSGWLEFESDMIQDSDFVLDSGRLKIDVQFDQAGLLIPDLDNKYDNRHHDVDTKYHGMDNKHPDRDGSAAVAAKMDEKDFPFNSPIASTFVFGDKKRAEDQTLSSVPRTVILETDLDHGDQILSRSLPRTNLFETDDELDHSDAYHDPDDCSVSDTDSSLTTFSLEADSDLQPSLWVSTRSFSYLREVVDHNSGFLDIDSRSGRFSVDLRQQKRLGRVDEHRHHPGPRPGVRLVCVKRESKRSRSSLLAPCLVCVSCWHQRAQDP